MGQLCQFFVQVDFDQATSLDMVDSCCLINDLCCIKVGQDNSFRLLPCFAFQIVESLAARAGEGFAE
jgi:hypothetical protein